MTHHVTYATNRESATSRGVNPIISIHRSVPSSSRRQHPSEVGPNRSSQTFWRQNWQITTFSKFAICSPGSAPGNNAARVSHELLKLRTSYKFSTFRTLCSMPSSGRTKGLNYRVQSSRVQLRSPMNSCRYALFSNFRHFE